MIADLTIKIATAFANIGTKNGTATPQNNDNRFAVAYEFFVAKKLKSLADAREKEAKAAAYDAGLLDGKFRPTTTEVVYKSDGLSIIAKTANPAERIDKAVLRGKLVRELGEAKADEIIKFATKESKAATSFDFIE